MCGAKHCRVRETLPVPGAAADVILDVEFERGLLFLVLENLGDEPAHAVRVRFDGPLAGLGGERRIDRLRLFRRLEFLGPRRRIRAFLDRSALFFAREERTAFEVRLSWRTDDGRRRSRTIRHDLDVYRDFPYLEVPHDG
jgi:hypothetical protein